MGTQVTRRQCVRRANVRCRGSVPAGKANSGNAPACQYYEMPGYESTWLFVLVLARSESGTGHLSYCLESAWLSSGASRVRSIHTKIAHNCMQYCLLCSSLSVIDTGLLCTNSCLLSGGCRPDAVCVMIGARWKRDQINSRETKVEPCARSANERSSAASQPCGFQACAAL
jgi:hypothetical protein